MSLQPNTSVSKVSDHEPRTLLRHSGCWSSPEYFLPVFPASLLTGPGSPQASPFPNTLPNLTPLLSPFPHPETPAPLRRLVILQTQLQCPLHARPPPTAPRPCTQGPSRVPASWRLLPSAWSSRLLPSWPLQQTRSHRRGTCRGMFAPWRISNKRFSVPDSGSVSLGNILLSATLVLEGVLFQECYPSSNTPTAGPSPKSGPSQQGRRAALPKRMDHVRSRWGPRNQLAGPRSVLGLCVQRRGGGLFSPVGLFGEEL